MKRFISEYAWNGVQEAKNLNRATIPTDGGGVSLINRPTGVVSGAAEVVFQNHDVRLIQEIESADYVLGAMAWLTHEGIINALSRTKDGCAVVVQKEDFLRPDMGARKDGWPEELRRRYGVLRNSLDRYGMPSPACDLSICGDPGFEAVRCVGNHNSERSPAFPRMHNKFFVLCDVEAERLSPHTVWTGSFNATANATNSLENALILRDEKIAQAYATEWAHIFALSEPLDWLHGWVAPEYRIGT